MDNAIAQKAADLIEASKNIIVFTGAGISTNSGIMDFRSENGLYNFVNKRYDLPYPEALFELDYFAQNPTPFFEIAKMMLSQDVRPSVCHKFVAWLEEQQKVSLTVTQNIDMLHQRAGLKRVVECHGTFQTARCFSCAASCSLKDIEADILNDKIPRCGCGGVIKPDIVFFGEAMPESFMKLLFHPPKADLILILGTSLQVQPSSQFALDIASKAPSVCVSLAPTPYDRRMTHVIREDLDEFADAVWNRLNKH
jgi:NAD-dependent SIR2 family protein deacetylase